MKLNVIELKEQIGKSKIIGGNFNTVLSVTDRNTRHNISNTEDMNNTINQQDRIGIYTMLPPPLPIAEYTFFSKSHIRFTNTDHILGHKRNSTYGKELKLYSVFSDNN